ncbi:hypothetical protein PoB_005819300, partial [Plakobranchus ocellatus]
MTNNISIININKMTNNKSSSNTKKVSNIKNIFIININKMTNSKSSSSTKKSLFILLLIPGDAITFSCHTQRRCYFALSKQVTGCYSLPNQCAIRNHYQGTKIVVSSVSDNRGFGLERLAHKTNKRKPRVLVLILPPTNDWPWAFTLLSAQNGQPYLLKPSESKEAQESYGKLPHNTVCQDPKRPRKAMGNYLIILYAKTNQDFTPGSPMLNRSIGLTSLLWSRISDEEIELNL